MLVITAHSVSEALSQGLHAIRIHGVSKPSRVGDVLVMPNPVMTVYKEPTNRVLFSPVRDANPFFHLMEALWMLAGRNDLPWLTRFNKQFASYSDDGGLTQPGAYGYRWRNYFGHDQLQDAILELKQNPNSRRVVITMWDGGARHSWLGNEKTKSVEDLAQPGDFFAAVGGSADVPCNTHIYFDTIDGRLNMTVCCRSNDIIWGAYGANAVHFSILLEYISAHTGIPMGVYRQFSNNYHLYTNIVPREEIMVMSRDALDQDRYYVPESKIYKNRVPASPGPYKVPLVEDPERFDKELMDFNYAETGLDASKFSEPFFNGVAVPMYNAYMYKKDRNYSAAIDLAQFIRAEDWRWACVEWLQRKKISHERNTKRFTEVAKPEINTNQDVIDTFGLEERSSDA